MFGVLGCTPSGSGNTDQNQGQVNELTSLIEEYYKTMSNRNWPEYQEMFCEEGTLTTVWSDSTGVERQIHTSTIQDFVASTAEGPDSQPIFEERPLNIEVEVKGILANAWVRYEAKFGSKESLMEWTGYDLFSFINHEGKWKIVSIVFAEENSTK